MRSLSLSDSRESSKRRRLEEAKASKLDVTLATRFDARDIERVPGEPLRRYRKSLGLARSSSSASVDIYTYIYFSFLQRTTKAR